MGEYQLNIYCYHNLFRLYDTGGTCGRAGDIVTQNYRYDKMNVDQKFNADDLYNSLKDNVWKFLRYSRLERKDVQQELYLLCLEVANGQSKYSPLVGGVHEYILGRMWGLVKRWIFIQSLEELTIANEESDESDMSVFLLPELQVPSAETTLISQNEIYEHDIIDVAQRCKMKIDYKNQSTLIVLVKTGQWSIRDAATFCGVNPYAIQRKMMKATLHGAPVTNLDNSP